MNLTVGELLALYNDENQAVNVMGFAEYTTVKNLFNQQSYLLNKKVDYWFINKRSKFCEICIAVK